MINIRNKYTFSLFLLVFLLLYVESLQAIKSAPLPPSSSTEKVGEHDHNKKLSLKERMALKLFKKHIEKVQMGECLWMVTIYGDALKIQDVWIGDDIIRYRRCDEDDDLISEMNLFRVSSVTDSYGQVLYDGRDLGAKIRELSRDLAPNNQNNVRAKQFSPKKRRLGLIILRLSLAITALFTLFGIAMLIIRR